MGVTLSPTARTYQGRCLPSPEILQNKKPENKSSSFFFLFFQRMGKQHGVMSPIQNESDTAFV